LLKKNLTNAKLLMNGIL